MNFVWVLFFSVIIILPPNISYMCYQLMIRKVLSPLQFHCSPYFFWNIQPVSLAALCIPRKMLLTSLMLMCFHVVRKTDEASEAPYSLRIFWKVCCCLGHCSQFCFFTTQHFVIPQVKIIYFSSEGHKPGWLACCFCSIYSVGSSTLGLPQELFTTFLCLPFSSPYESCVAGLLLSAIVYFQCSSKPGFSADAVAMFQLTTCDSDLPIDT